MCLLIDVWVVRSLEPMELKGSRTERNLLAAFAGESQARTRYTFFASVAKKEGFEQISAIFTETADNENCLLYTSPSPRDRTRSRMPSSA